MIRIGDFSKLSRVSVKALRYYDEVDLLKPIEVDPVTGYRYYELAQLQRLNRILALKDMGFSLQEIGQLLADDLTPEQIARDAEAATGGDPGAGAGGDAAPGAGREAAEADPTGGTHVQIRGRYQAG